jgi:hypothetical protein
VFPPKTDNFQKLVRFVSPAGNGFGEKKGEKPKEKPHEEPLPNPKPKPIIFHYVYCGR